MQLGGLDFYTPSTVGLFTPVFWRPIRRALNYNVMTATVSLGYKSVFSSIITLGTAVICAVCRWPIHYVAHGCMRKKQWIEASVPSVVPGIPWRSGVLECLPHREEGNADSPAGNHGNPLGDTLQSYSFTMKKNQESNRVPPKFFLFWTWRSRGISTLIVVLDGYNRFLEFGSGSES